MRLWSIHPVYLDTKGLVAAWREGLLAQKCLQEWLKGNICGYQNHSQLIRFKHEHTAHLVGTYLHSICDEADTRGYNFDRNKVEVRRYQDDTIPVTSGQVVYEFEWLLNKLRERDPSRYKQLDHAWEPTEIRINPTFRLTPGSVEPWEKT